MFLERIVESAKKRLEVRQREHPLGEIKALTLSMPRGGDYPFETALSRSRKCGDIAFICEVKKASPSKGVIADDFPYAQIAADYEAGGAAAISVLTEPEFFLGSDEYLREIARSAGIPALRKDFIISPYQIYEAKTLGAAAVLLIAELWEREPLREMIDLAHELGLSALVESHSEPQMEKAIAAGARVIGVNNRDLVTFEVDISTSVRLRRSAPADLIFVSESGISGRGDIEILAANNVNAVLIGETLMRAADRVKALRDLMGA